MTAGRVVGDIRLSVKTRAVGVGLLVLALAAPVGTVFAAPVSAAGASDPSVLLFVREAASTSSLMSVALDPTTGLPSSAASTIESSTSLAYRDLAVSPDGSQVAYVTDNSTTDVTSVRVRAVDGSGTGQMLVSTASAFPGVIDPACTSNPTACAVAEPAWSPDGASLLVTRYGADTGTDYRPGNLFTVPAAGGAISALPGGALASHGSYVADGSAVIAADEDPDAPVRLLRISTSGTRTAVTGGASAYSPSVSPDGQWIAAIRPEDAQTDSIVVLPVSGGSAVTVSDVVADPTALVLDAAPTWTADSVRVYFDRLLVDAGGSKVTVRSAARNGGSVVALPAAAGADEGWPAFSGGDRTAPVARLLTPTASVQLTSTASVSWTANDPGLSGVAGYDVRFHTISSAGVYSGFTTWRTATTALSASMSLTGGVQYCWSVRATDNDANVGAWSVERCSSSPLDDRQLTKSRGWTTASHPAYYRGSVISTTTGGSTASTATVKYRQVGFVTRTCSTCGSFTVYLGSRKLTTVNTRSSTTRNSYVVWMAFQSSPSTGVIKIVANAGNRVYVDGVVLRRQ